MQACESVQIGSSGLTIDLNTNKLTTCNEWVTFMPVTTRIERHVDNIHTLLAKVSLFLFTLNH